MLDPNAPHSTASLTNGVSLIIELIRKNNRYDCFLLPKLKLSDYDIEPVLTLTLESHPPTNRDPIYLGTMLRLFASRIKDFQKLLAKPKSVPPSIATTFGHIEPLGFERFRICELYAELLHCSNMVLLNDPRGEDIVRERDKERNRLRKEGHSKLPSVDIWGDTDLGNGKQWGTSETYSTDGSEDGGPKEKMENQASVGNHVGEKQAGSDPAPEPSLSIVTNEEKTNLPPTDVNIEPPQESQDLEEERIQSRELQAKQLNATDSKLLENPPEPHTKSDGANDNQNRNNGNGDNSPEHARIPSMTGSSVKNRPVVGDYLKMQFVEAKVLPSVVDLFFAHPWNNFLHNVVYDILTQVLNGPMDKGFNRQLAVDLFKDG
jgi:SIT4 phosphatase-associated protein